MSMLIQQSAVQHGLEDVRELWTPADLSPYAWYDAELSPKTIPLLTQVSQWNDISGNQLHASSPTQTRRPLYDAANKWLSFDGVDDYFYVPSPLIATGNSPFTIFAVVTPRSTSGHQKIYSQGDRGADNGTPNLGFVDNKFFHGAWASDYAPGTISSGTQYIAAYRYGSGTRAVYANGSQIGSQNYSSGSWRNNFPVIGSLASTEQFAYMRLRTLIFFRSSLSDADRNKVEGYLAHLWSATNSLPASHPYKVRPPTR